MDSEVAANLSLRGRLTAGSVRGYERHRPEETELHSVVREQLETFLARARERDRAVPGFIEKELRAYLECGILAHGFLRLHCDECRQGRLVPFSCKRRGFCPSCGGRRMADTAAHLVDCVLPEVPIRQWVLTLPYALRYRCAYDARLTSQVLRAFVRSVFAGLRQRARDRWNVARGQCGAVTFIQRFGSALNLNVHFHTLVLDGVYPRDDGTAPRFLPLPPPSAGEIARVLTGTARRIQRLLASRTEDDDALARDEPLLATLATASLRTRIAIGPHAGLRWQRLGDRVTPEDSNIDPEASPRVRQHDGMSLHAGVAVPARDRRRLERLCRHVARPSLANDRLEGRPDGRLALRLKTRWRDGTTHILMERHELLERLVPLIPPPRAHQVRYHGVLARCASARDRIVPGPRPPLRRAGAEARKSRSEAIEEPADASPSGAKAGRPTDGAGRAIPTRRRMRAALRIYPSGQAVGRSTGIHRQPGAQSHGDSRGPSSSSVSSESLRCAVPGVGRPCVWSRPSRNRRWPARSSNASTCPRERRRSGRR